MGVSVKNKITLGILLLNLLFVAGCSDYQKEFTFTGTVEEIFIEEELLIIKENGEVDEGRKDRNVYEIPVSELERYSIGQKLEITVFSNTTADIWDLDNMKFDIKTVEKEKQPEESIEVSANQTENKDYKARIVNVDTDLEKENGSHFVPEGVNTMAISVKVENVESILFWITENGTGTWAERTLIGYDIDGSDGWSITWEFGDRTFLDYVTIQALGSDGVTQATESINLRSRSAVETEGD